MNQHSSYAGSYSSACRLSTTVLYFRHDQNHEGESCAPDVPFASRAKERVVGRAFVESVLLCCNDQ